MGEAIGRLNGQCLCGAVRLSVVPSVPELHACHCEMCRRWTGSAFVEIDVAPADLTVTGPVKARATSDWAERAWCGDCGSKLWYRLTVPGQEFYAVSAGLFPDGGGLPLTREIYADCRLPGVEFAGAHPRLSKAETEAGFAEMAADAP